MEPRQFDPSTEIPLEDLRRRGLEAYRRLHEVVTDPRALDRWLASEVGTEDADTVREIVAGLPPPVDGLPLWVVAALARHALDGVLEWFWTLGPGGTAATSEREQVARPLRDWLEEHRGALESLLLATEPSSLAGEEPWRGWTPEDAPGGRVDAGTLLRRAEAAAEPLFSDLDVGTVGAFVLLRDWHEELSPLLEALGIAPLTLPLLQLRHRIEELRQVVGASKTAGSPDVVSPTRRAAHDQLGLRVQTLVERYRGRLAPAPAELRADSAWGLLLGLPGEWVAGAPVLAEALADEERVVTALRRAAPAPGYRPSATVTRDYWTTTDTLGYGIYADAVAEFVWHPDTRPPLTIGIKAPWGAGKTSLMRMVRERLDPGANDGAPATVRVRRPREEVEVTNRTALRHTAPEDGGAAPESAFEPEPEPEPDGDDRRRTTVWFNPWTYQSGEHLWAGLAQAIVDGVTGRMGPLERERFWFELNLGRVDRARVRHRLYRLLFERVLPLVVPAAVLLAAGAGLLLLVPGLAAALAGWTSLGGAVLAGAAGTVRARRFLGADVRGSLDELVRQPDYEHDAGALHLVQADMRRVLDLVATPRRPLVVFVDDLDRCSADVVGDVIEALNLFLGGQYPNCVFVLALEPDVVAAHLEAGRADLLRVLDQHLPEGTHFGMGWRFLDKMVQLPLRLPAPEGTQLDGYIDSVLGSRRAARPLDRATVRRRAERLRAELASIEQLRAAAAEVERDERDRLRGEPGAQPAGGGGSDGGAEGERPRLDEETIRAAEEAVADRLRDDAPEVREVVGEYAKLLTGNPRDVKRFVNLFRFYAFVQVRRQLRDLPAPSLAQVGKMAILAIRWPYLLSVLGLPVPADGRTRVLGSLEEAAGGADGPWAKAVREAGLRERMQELIVADDDLRQVLARDPPLAGVVGFL